MSEEKLFTKILVEIKGLVIVNITDLPKEQYEYFLKLIRQLDIEYHSIKPNTP